LVNGNPDPPLRLLVFPSATLKEAAVRTTYQALLDPTPPISQYTATRSAAFYIVFDRVQQGFVASPVPLLASLAVAGLGFAGIIPRAPAQRGILNWKID
jgi:hypothetical protein